MNEYCRKQVKLRTMISIREIPRIFPRMFLKGQRRKKTVHIQKNKIN